jgi:hypothetical protein
MAGRWLHHTPLVPAKRSQFNLASYGDQPVNVVCQLCRTVILPAQPVTLTGDRWVHMACLVRRQPMIGPHSGA